MRGWGWRNRLQKLVVQAEGEAVVERSVCCTGGKEPVQTEPAAVVGSESEYKTAPSGCGRENPEAEAWVS